MYLLQKAYRKLRLTISQDTEKGKLSSGYLPYQVRKNTLKLGRAIFKNNEENLLEIGCGEGLFLIGLAKNFPNFKIIGIDRSNQLLNGLEGQIEKLGFNNISLICANADNLPFRDSCFNNVICINSVCNFTPQNLLTIFKEIQRACKPEANFIFDIRNKLNPLLVLGYKLAKYFDPNCPQYLICYRLKEILKLLKRLNFLYLSKVSIGLFLKAFAPAILIFARKHNT